MSSLPDLHDVDITNYVSMLYLETKVSQDWGTAQPQFLKVCSDFLYPWHGSIRLNLFEIAISRVKNWPNISNFMGFNPLYFVLNSSRAGMSVTVQR